MTGLQQRIDVEHLGVLEALEDAEQGADGERQDADKDVQPGEAVDES